MEQPVLNSQQGLAQAPPAEEAQYLSCRLACVICGYMRTYRLTQTLRALASRETAHLRIQARCEGCQREIGMTLFWDPRESQYSYAPLALGQEAGPSDVQPLKVCEKSPI